MLFSYDISTRTITDNTYRDYDGSLITFKIGELFLDFINSDFSIYDMKRKKTIEFCLKHSEETDSSEKDLIDFFPDISEHLSAFCELNHGFSFSVLYEYLLYSYDNPYLHLNYSSDHGIPFLFRDKGPLDFLFLQHRLIKSFITCIDIDLIGKDSPVKRYMENEGLSYEMAGTKFCEETIFRYKYSWKENNAYEIRHYANAEEFEPIRKPLEEISLPLPAFMRQPKVNPECKEREIEIIHGYSFKSTEEALKCEFLKMLELGILIRKCDVCKKYFIPTKHNGKCCNNLYKNTGLTCQQVYANRNYTKKKKEHPILKEYNRAYKRMYARRANNKITPNEFLTWQDIASQKKKYYVDLYDNHPSAKIINEFKQFLNNK